MTLGGFWVALQFLTRLPTPRLTLLDGASLSRSAPWFPVVGALIGAIVAGAVLIGAPVDPWFGALLGLGAWVSVTGALHLDGLSDVADGLGAKHGSPERFLEVMRDPSTGAFGVTAIGMQLLAKLVLLALLARTHEIAVLILVAAWARWAVLLLAAVVPPLAGGLGASFASRLDGTSILVAALVLVVASAVFAPFLLGALPAAVLLVFYWRRRVGGITGDCLGASIEVMETALLVLQVAGTALLR